MYFFQYASTHILNIYKAKHNEIIRHQQVKQESVSCLIEHIFVHKISHIHRIYLFVFTPSIVVVLWFSYFLPVVEIYSFTSRILYLHTYESYESNLKRDTFLTDFSLLEQLLVKRCKNNSLKKFLVERKGFFYCCCY